MNVRLTDRQWQKLLPFLKSCLNIYIGREAACRTFLEAVLWIARSGAQWRLLPRYYGRWNSIYKRFARWSQHNVFERLFTFCAATAELQSLLIDSTIVRAHACSAGARKEHGPQALGRSRGGFSTKIHLTTDESGTALRFILTAGERDDSTQAENLIEGFEFEALLGDKAYDIDRFLQPLIEREIKIVVPTRVNRKVQREIDRLLYRQRNQIERLIGKLKQYRRIFSRFDKLAKNYLSFIHLVAVFITLK